ncbi:response regulator transcription factor [Anaerosporobacter faecicola]|uniref:response regulator transcription factor n=1 Tax=Anaerosporobacter faecicola TaxID=2718714 RepID=UPI00143C7FCA|nr:response regulator [Anaerosporobacter faecicola]
MLKLFIADDEDIVREGLKNILDWEELGFKLCGEGTNGINTLEGILANNPDLVLLDIRMPKMHGTELARRAREEGFTGRIIILSGYSDFKYAQDAIRCGVNYYLTKPVDEDELLDAVKSIQEAIRTDQERSSNMETYREKAKDSILRDIIQDDKQHNAPKTSDSISNSLNLEDLNLVADSYRALILDGYYPQDTEYYTTFCKLLRVSSIKSRNVERVNIADKEVVIIKGEMLLKQFQAVLDEMELNPKSDSFSNLFIAAGRVINNINDVYFSYHDALTLLNRRFFCEKHQHMLLPDQLPNADQLTYAITEEDSKHYCNLFYQYIQTYNRKGIESSLDELKNNLFYCKESIDSIQSFLTGIFLHLKHLVEQNYSDKELHLNSNSEIIDFIHHSRYLYEIIQYFNEQFDQIIKAIGNSSSDSVIDDILYYIRYNYKNNLKLDTLAPMFGYNSSYLGKVFSKKVGSNFNSYVDQIRIAQAKEMLLQDNLKVYEISKNVGYKNVDYFHKKFKKYVGISPAEYRNKHNIQDID